MDQFITMIITVVVSLAVSAVLFIGANRAVDSVRGRWPAFTAAVGGMVGLVAGAVVQHNGWLPRGPALGRTAQGGLAGPPRGRSCGRGNRRGRRLAD